MENQFGPIMAAKSDAELQSILHEKHRYEPAACLAAFEELERRGLTTPELLQEKENLLESSKHNNSEEKKGSHRQSWKETLALFTITKEYFYTPVIIYSNVLIWVLMVATGVNAFEPSVESLINWGGNLSALTLKGEPWRLLTSTFLHGGILHLLLNMYALLQVGAVLEVQFGKHRYVLVYLVTGILASIASASFSENVVSVGASGAIFGLFGLLLSLLITKSLQITPEARTNLLYSTLTFIGYNVAFGFAKAGIDNAAHIGGLLSGFIIGFLYYPFMGQPKKAAVLSATLTAVVLILVWAAPYFITNRYGEYQSAIETFVANEEKALWMFKEDFPVPGTPQAERYRERLKTEGIDLWQENLALMDSLNDMPVDLQARIDLLKKYCLLRSESYELMQQLTYNNSEEQTNRLTEVSNEIANLIASLEALNK